jgi:hypothetical protein
VSPRRLSALLACALIALALGGCGRGADERTVGSVTAALLQAVEARTAAVACAQLTSAAVRSSRARRASPAAQAVTSVQASPGPVRRAAVYITSAKVDLTKRRERLPQPDLAGWKLSAVGCKPQAGKPADQTIRLRPGGVMRAVFVLYLVVITVGLTYFIALGLLQR